MADQNPDRFSPPDSGPFKRERSRFRVVGPAGLSNEAIEERKVKEYGPGGFGETTTTDMAFCASCQAVMHKPEEVGGVCNVCGLLLGLDCSKYRCEFCRRCVCQSQTRDARGKPFCITHGRLQVLKYLLFGR